MAATPATHPVRIAMQLHPQHGDYATLRAAVARAEEMGVDIVYNWDHFYPLYGDPGGKHFEAWTMLAAWAEQTSRIEIGCLVTCNSYRNPNLLADMARTVDHISGGRLVFGIGSGWFKRDYDEYGYEFGTAGSRLDALARDLPIIKTRWNQLTPPPTREIPILIGGTGPRKTMRILAEHGTGWHAMFPEHPGDLEIPIEALQRWCGEIGRDPHEIEWGLGLEPGDRNRMLTQHADALYELGFTQITIGANGPEYSFDGVEDWLAWRDERYREVLVQRCGWPGEGEDYVSYHDDEWGRPTLDGHRLFEKICLEGFQSGLSWLTILRKRDNFRQAFLGFDYERVSSFGAADVERLLGNAGIIRHRGKIEATINNARRAVEMEEIEGSFVDWIWAWAVAQPERTAGGHLPSQTSRSAALAKELKQRGWRFFGPTTAYAFMQSEGLTNDHETRCFAHGLCEEERTGALAGRHLRP